MKMHYEMDELVPLVARLAEKYTSKESSSVSYNIARQLMGAVQYCIHEYELGTTEGFRVKTTKSNSNGAKESYQLGYQMVLDKVQEAKKIYDRIQPGFCTLKNECYEDTVLEGMSAFFLYYDPLCQPQNHILTLDYPILPHFQNMCGIDLIYAYLSCIEQEQDFLRSFEQEMLTEILSSWRSDYRELLINLCGVVNRILVGRMLQRQTLQGVEQVPHKWLQEHDYRRLERWILPLTKNQLSNQIEELTAKLVARRCKNPDRVKTYLAYDRADFVTELRNAAEHQCLETMFI